MIFTQRNKRHRKNGMNAFDKRIMQGIASIAGAGFLVSGMTAASAKPVSPDFPTENIIESVSESEIITPIIDSTISLQVVQIPVVEGIEKAEEPELSKIEIIIEKPEPVIEEKDTDDAKLPEELIKTDDTNTEEASIANSDVDKVVSGEKSAVNFVAPLDSMNVSSSFGYRIHPITGAGKLHAGTDFGISCGTPVYATADGEVVHSGYKNGTAGNIVEIDHGVVDGSQVSSNYYHLSETIAENGSFVKQGDVIGKVGTTGSSTGCHLHWEIVQNGEKTDPMIFLEKF